MQLTGFYYPAGSSERHPATLDVSSEQYTLNTELGEQLRGAKSDLNPSDRLGNVERKIYCPQGVFTTADNDTVDALFKKQSAMAHVIHTVESNLAWVVMAMFITVISGYGFIAYGMPWLGNRIAHILPHETNEIIAEQSFEFLDKYMLSPSHLNEERQQQLKDHFDQQLVQVLFEPDHEVDYRLHFRRWGDDEHEIPNALALPSGDIILTDRFVELAQNQQEIDAVLLHEIGHVVERHSLQMLVQSTLMATVIMMITGDTTALGDLGIGLGSILVSSHYSRTHETEADHYAFQHMLTMGIDPVAFSTIMARIEGDMHAHDHDTEAPISHHEEENWMDYLSTHPSTEQRISQAQQFGECFKQGLKQCEIKPVE